MAKINSFADVLRRAIADFEANGFDSEERLDRWRRELATAADVQTAITPESLQRTLKSVFTTQVTGGGIVRVMNIPQWRLNQLLPRLHNELEHRIMASAQLIKLNRDEMISKTIRRFSGWATSIPVGGSRAVDKNEASAGIKKALKALPFEERRVMIDQAAKFKAQISNIVASETGAIAGIWRSHFRAPGYHFRPDHKERDGHVYVVRGNWALENGLMKLDGNAYTDEVTMPAEEVFCQCRYKYLFSLRDLPDSMLTEKGRATIKR